MLLITISLIIYSCVDPFDLETKTFESAIVIEATITNEFKYQEINLTRTFKLEENGPSKEMNALVKVIDDTQNTFVFNENEPGQYISETRFSAKANTNYKLSITTSNGKRYSSKPTQLTQITQIDSIYTLSSRNLDGSSNISIFLDSFDPMGNSKLYRYEYEETYKIIVPFWSNLDAIIISDTIPFKIDTEPRKQEERVCYKTIKSNTILQFNTNTFSEDRVTKFPIRVIKSNDFVLRERYSILVKQFVQSFEAFSFFKKLEELSTNSGSLFSQNQPGFLQGNVFSIDDSNEKVLGFFEVSSIDKKRIFFNFKDIFPNLDLPPFIPKGCEIMDIPLTSDSGQSSPLINLIKSNRVKFFEFPQIPSERFPIRVVNRNCGDCTVFGNNTKPSFWVD